MAETELEEKKDEVVIQDNHPAGGNEEVVAETTATEETEEEDDYEPEWAQSIKQDGGALPATDSPTGDTVSVTKAEFDELKAIKDAYQFMLSDPALQGYIALRQQNREADFRSYISDLSVDFDNMDPKALYLMDVKSKYPNMTDEQLSDVWDDFDGKPDGVKLMHIEDLRKARKQAQQEKVNSLMPKADPEAAQKAADQVATMMAQLDSALQKYETEQKFAGANIPKEEAVLIKATLSKPISFLDAKGNFDVDKAIRTAIAQNPRQFARIVTENVREGRKAGYLKKVREDANPDAKKTQKNAVVTNETPQQVFERQLKEKEEAQKKKQS